MYFEDIFEYIGGAGWYQVCLVLCCSAYFLLSFDALATNFIGGDMKHWCHIPALENFTHDQQKYIGIPEASGGSRSLDPWLAYGNLEADLDYDECKRFPLDFDNYTLDDLRTWNRTEQTDHIPSGDLVSCDKGWVYDKSLFVSTIGSEWDLVCGKAWIVPMASTLYMAGWLIGNPLTGICSDKFGRKTMLMVIYLGRCVGLYLIRFAPHYMVFLTGRLLVGIFNPNVGLVINVIMQEISDKEHRAFFTLLWSILSHVGKIIAAVIAIFVRDWVSFVSVFAYPVLFPLPFLIWLIMQGREEEAVSVVRKIAEINNKKTDCLPKDLHFKEERIAGIKRMASKQNMGDLFRTPNLRKKMFILCFLWFTASLLTYGLSLNAGSLPGSVHMNALLLSSVEIPFNFLGIYLLGKFGRRKAIGFSLGIAGVLMLACIPFRLNADVEVWATVLSILGKGVNGMAFGGLYVMTAELAPTTLRTGAMGLASMCARISGMAAPYVGGPLGDVWVGLPSLIFGCFAVAAGGATVFLPETLGRKLPETAEEAEAFGTKPSKLDPIETNVTCSTPKPDSVSNGAIDKDLYTSSAICFTNPMAEELEFTRL